jgi:hypothetical protein
MLRSSTEGVAYAAAMVAACAVMGFLVVGNFGLLPELPRLPGTSRASIDVPAGRATRTAPLELPVSLRRGAVHVSDVPAPDPPGSAPHSPPPTEERRSPPPGPTGAPVPPIPLPASDDPGGGGQPVTNTAGDGASKSSGSGCGKHPANGGAHVPAHHGNVKPPPCSEAGHPRPAVLRGTKPGR